MSNGDQYWREGYEAYEKRPVPENPYQEGTAEYVLWEIGLTNASEDATWRPDSELAEVKVEK